METAIALISCFISAVAVIVAICAMKSSSRDAKQQVQAIMQLIALQIDDIIILLEAECHRLDNVNQSFKVQSENSQNAFSTFNKYMYSKSPTEEAIEANNMLKNALMKRIADLKKRKEIILKNE